MLSLRNKILCIILIVGLLPVIVTGFLSNLKFNHLLEVQAREMISDLLQQSEGYLRVYLTELEQMNLFISTNEEVIRVLSKTGFDSEFEKVMDANALTKEFIKYKSIRRDIERVDIIGLNGFTYLGNYTLHNKFYEDHLEEPWMQRIVEQRGNPVWMIDESGRHIICARLITGENYNHKLGVIRLYIPFYQLEAVFKQFQLQKSGFFLLLDDNNRVILQLPRAGQSDEFIAETDLETRTDRLIFQNKDMLVSHYDIAKTGWSFMTAVPENDIVQGMSSIRNYFLQTLLIVFVISISVSAWLSQRLTKPVKQLIQLMHKVEGGNFDTRMVIRSNDEIGLLAISYNRMIQRVDNLIEEIYDQQARKNEAEWKTLQAQINPHFLYNTLDSINWIARMNGIAEISHIVTALSRMFKLSLAKGDKYISVKEELEYIGYYKKIQEIRFSDRIAIMIDVPDTLHNIMIPRFILQPLVENSVIHGLENKEEPGTIWVKGAEYKDKVLFIVQDDGVGIPPDKLKHVLLKDSNNRLGLSNVDERIKLLYGKEWGLKIDSIENKGTVVEIWLKKRMMGGTPE